MQKQDKIFIAGETGLVGSAIIRSLQQSGSTNLLANYNSRQPQDDSLHWVQLDLTYQAAVQSFFTHHQPSYVFLAAAKVGGIMANNKYRADFIYHNLQIQNNIIHQSHEHGVKKLLFLGSSCIYPKMCPQPMQEEHLLTSPLEYTNEPYATAKIAGIKMCESYNLQYGTNFISVMPINLYGPGDNFDLETSHVLPALLRKMHLARMVEQEDVQAIERDEKCFGPIPAEILKDLGLEREEPTAEAPRSKSTDESNLCFAADKAAKKNDSSLRLSGEKPLVRIWGSGRPKREFLWSEDMAQACVFIKEKIDFSDLPKNLSELRNIHINIGSGEEISIKDLALAVKDVVGFEGELTFDATKPDGTPRKLTDISKLHGLGWRHTTSLDQGIRRFYEWYVGN